MRWYKLSEPRRLVHLCDKGDLEGWTCCFIFLDVCPLHVYRLCMYANPKCGPQAKHHQGSLAAWILPIPNKPQWIALNKLPRDFPGSPDPMLPIQQEWVWSLKRELRSHNEPMRKKKLPAGLHAHSFQVMNWSHRLQGTSTHCCCCLVAKSCRLFFCNPMDCSLPGSSIHGISQAKRLEWVVISLSRGFSWPKKWTPLSCIAGGFFTA